MIISNVHFAFLKILSEERDPLCRKFLLRAFCKDKKFIKVLRYLCKMTINGKFNIPPKEYKKLKQYISDLKLFSSKRKANKSRISQNGAGFLTVLFPIVASVLGSLVNGALSKNDDGSV